MSSLTSELRQFGSSWTSESSSICRFLRADRRKCFAVNIIAFSIANHGGDSGAILVVLQYILKMAPAPYMRGYEPMPAPMTFYAPASAPIVGNFPAHAPSEGPANANICPMFWLLDHHFQELFGSGVKGGERLSSGPGTCSEFLEQDRVRACEEWKIATRLKAQALASFVSGEFTNSASMYVAFT